MDGTDSVRQIRWAIGFGVAAALAAAFGAAIFAVWGDDGDRTGMAAATRTLRDARVLVWVGFAVAAGFVLAGRDRLTSEVDRIFEEDRRVWDRRVLNERGSAAGTAGSNPPSVPNPNPNPGPLPHLGPELAGDAATETGAVPAPDAAGGSPRSGSSVPARPTPLPALDCVRAGPSGRLFTAGGVLIGAGAGAGIGALAGELATGAVLGVVAGLLAGLLLERGEG